MAGPHDVARAASVCHVVTIPVDRMVRAGDANSATLSGEALLAVGEAALPWRDTAYMARDLHVLRERYAPGGLIVWFVPMGRPVRVPPPLEVHIEPLPLSDAIPAIIALAGAADQPGAEMPAPQPAPGRRWLARLGVTIAFVPLLVNGLLQVVFSRETLMRIVGSVVVLGLVVATLVVWLSRYAWYLIPGGIVARRTVGRAAIQINRAARTDSVLVVRSLPINWQAEVLGPNGVLKRQLTDIECVALLRAWQSPLDPPPDERLSDLR